MKLYYSHNLNPRVAVAVARHLGSPVEFIRARPFHPAQIEDFRKLNPNTRVPVLEEHGRTLWETDAIACRLSAVAGSDFWRKGLNQPQMIQWISWATHHLNSAAAVLYFEHVVSRSLRRSSGRLRRARRSSRKPCGSSVSSPRSWMRT